MYRVYRNQATAAYSSIYFITFFFSNFQALLKLGTYMDSGQMNPEHQNQAAAAYLSYYFFIFLSLQFSNIEIFHHTFLQSCGA